MVLKEAVCEDGWSMDHHAMKSYGGVEVNLHTFLTSTLYGGELYFHAPSNLSPEK
jgi:hypothetical protein